MTSESLLTCLTWLGLGSRMCYAWRGIQCQVWCDLIQSLQGKEQALSRSGTSELTHQERRGKRTCNNYDRKLGKALSRVAVWSGLQGVDMQMQQPGIHGGGEAGGCAGPFAPYRVIYLLLLRHLQLRSKCHDVTNVNYILCFHFWGFLGFH